MKYKRILNGIVCTLLSVLLAVCLNKSEYSETVVPLDSRDTIEILAPQTSENALDAEKVVEAINRMGLDYKVEFDFIPFQSWPQVVHQYLSSDEQLDLVYGSNTSLFELYSGGKLCALNTLLNQHGQGITAAVKEEYFKVGRFQGQQYALPMNRSLALSFGFEYRVDLAEQYGLDFSSVTSLNDLEAVFEQLSAQTDAVTPMVYYQADDWDGLGDNLGVLLNQGGDSEIVNLYETPQYREYIERIYRWRNNGWVVDTVSMSMNNTDYLRSGRVLGSLTSIKPGFDVQETRSVGYPIESVELVSPYVTTDQVGRMMWAISKNSRYPEYAMDFLNRMYTDPELYNLLTFGIENEHYQFIDPENKVIDYPPGVDAQNSGYAQFLGWMYGNQYLSYIWNGNETDLWEQTRAFNDNARRSAAMGFVFDTSPVSEIWTNCRSVQSKYESALEQGYLNPEIYLERLNRELYAAGFGTLLQEKQNQLLKWKGDER